MLGGFVFAFNHGLLYSAAMDYDRGVEIGNNYNRWNE